MVSLSPNIGKIAGITIQLHWTFIALILLLFVLLATSTQGLFYFLLIILLFVCVLIHELAHSLVSKNKGIKVTKIVLLPIGGASMIDYDKLTPKLEVLISVAGPLVSLALGGLFGLLYLYVHTGLLGQAVYILFELNILLGLFNLLPGFPLDGGRVLRGYLQRKYNFMKATKLAVKVSYAVIVALIVGTIIYAVLIPNVSFAYRYLIAFWDLIIALFLYDGAKFELVNAEIRQYSSKMTVAHMASKNFILADVGMRTDGIYKSMVEKGTRIVLVKKGSRFFGVRDKRLGEIVKNSQSISQESLRLFDVPVPQIPKNEKLSKAIDMMRNGEINIIVVMSGRSVSGILYAPYVEAALEVYLSQKKSKSNKNGS